MNYVHMPNETWPRSGNLVNSGEAIALIGSSKLAATVDEPVHRRKAKWRSADPVPIIWVGAITFIQLTSAVENKSSGRMRSQF